MAKIKVKVFNSSENDLPAYANTTDAGIDLRASRNVIVPAYDRVLVKTGIFTEIPAGYEVQIRPRSGLALKSGITVLNTPGTIDAGYRHEWGVVLFNSTNKNFHIAKGERIAQAVIKQIDQIEWVPVSSREELTKDERDGGFGSTGK